jgi:hypothetical protein
LAKYYKINYYLITKKVKSPINGAFDFLVIRVWLEFEVDSLFLFTLQN